jgi:cytochrome c biogenesis protein CcdA
MVAFRFLLLAVIGFGSVLGAVFFGVLIIDSKVTQEARQLAFYGTSIVIVLGLLLSTMAIFLRRHALDNVATEYMRRSDIGRSNERREAVE